MRALVLSLVLYSLAGCYGPAPKMSRGYDVVDHHDPVSAVPPPPPVHATDELTLAQYEDLVADETMAVVDRIIARCFTKSCIQDVMSESQEELKRLASRSPEATELLGRMSVEEAHRWGEDVAARHFTFEQRRDVYGRLRRWETETCIDCGH